MICFTMLRKITLALLLQLFFMQSFAAAKIESGFSPEGSARTLVLKIIQAARKNIKLMGYSFTAPDITAALIEARQRGVRVSAVLDERGNHGKINLKMMKRLANAGVLVRLDGHYRIQHDKVIIVDDKNIETGSFNFTASAEKRNSENVVVLWNDPEVAKKYIAHWQSRWNFGSPYKKRRENA